MLAVAHEARGELAEAVRALERALEVGGLESDLVRMRLVRVRAELARRGGPPGGQPRAPHPMDPNGVPR
jgi:undecaprenyl pyrophosphate synthase